MCVTSSLIWRIFLYISIFSTFSNWTAHVPWLFLLSFAHTFFLRGAFTDLFDFSSSYISLFVTKIFQFNFFYNPHVMQSHSVCLWLLNHFHVINWKLFSFFFYHTQREVFPSEKNLTCDCVSVKHSAQYSPLCSMKIVEHFRYWFELCNTKILTPSHFDKNYSKQRTFFFRKFFFFPIPFLIFEILNDLVAKSFEELSIMQTCVSHAHFLSSRNSQITFLSYNSLNFSRSNFSSELSLVTIRFELSSGWKEKFSERKLESF